MTASHGSLRNIQLFIGVLFIAGALSLNGSVHAQVTGNEQLRAAIQTSLLSDPRTAQMSPQQLEQLVDALVGESQHAGLEAQDINAMMHASLPTLEKGPGLQIPPQACGMFPSLCPFNDAFGFDDTDQSLFVWTFLASALAFVFLLKMKQIHEYTPAVTADTSQTQTYL